MLKISKANHNKCFEYRVITLRGEQPLADRFRELGVEVDFSAVAVPRQFLEASQSTQAARNRAGVIRMLTEYADGNPWVALRLWANSLVGDETGKVLGALPSLVSTAELDSLPLSGLLVLRIIVQFERVTAEDIRTGLRMSESEVGTAIRSGLARGWICEEQGYYTLHWRWFPVVIRVLARQNLLAR